MISRTVRAFDDAVWARILPRALARRVALGDGDADDLLLALGLAERLVALDGLELLVDIAAQHDVGTTAGHVGGNGDHARAAGLGYDLGFAGVKLGGEALEAGQAFGSAA